MTPRKKTTPPSWWEIIMGSHRLRMTVLVGGAIILIGALLCNWCVRAVGKGGSQAASADRSSVTSPATTDNLGEVTIRNPGEYSTTTAMDQAICDYMAAWFDSLSKLETADLSPYFDAESTVGAESVALDNTALAYLVGVRSLQSNDLTLTHYSVGVTYTDIEQLRDGTTEVTLDEDHTVNFAFLGDTDSISAGIAHTFVLSQTGSGYAILEHEKDEDGFLLVEEMAEEQGISTRENWLETLLSEAEADIVEMDAERSAAVTTTESEGETYNRSAAVDYAMEWTDDTEVVRNTQDFGIYDMYGGNCNNFISQCLYAGGIPMDTSGEDQWKWYGDEVNTRNSESGRSTSWTGVEEFYDYAQSNTGEGLIADTTLGVYDGQAGDVLQYGTSEGWAHSVLITDVVYDDTGAVEDYLINSNTTDRIDYPASAYAYADMRLIHVSGYNEE